MEPPRARPTLGQAYASTVLRLVLYLFIANAPAEVRRDHMERARRGTADLDRDLAKLRSLMGNRYDEIRDRLPELLERYGDLRDPYPDFHAKRRDRPVELMADGGYEIYPYDLVSSVMRDNVTFASGSIREFMSVVMGPYPLVGMDEPEHRRLRALVAQAFRQRNLAHWDEDLVVPVVDEMIDGFAARVSARTESRLRADPSVVAVDPDVPLSVQGTGSGPARPSDYLQDTRAVNAHQAGWDGSGATVALVDTGVARVPDVAGRVWRVVGDVSG